MRHFKYSDFKCNHCGLNHMDYFFINKLDVARDIAGIPFNSISGFRCPIHNINEGGSDTSSHLTGLADDLEILKSRQRFLTVKSLIQVGFNRIGVGPDFVHVDDDKTKDQSVMWLY